jgi:hypothetical protein
MLTIQRFGLTTSRIFLLFSISFDLTAQVALTSLNGTITDEQGNEFRSQE